MDTGVVSILIILVAYLSLVLIVGLYSWKYSRPTMEDYHLAGREFNTFILFCAVFGTNISAVALIGGPGKAYHVGWIIWPYFVTSWAWLTPILFFVIGHRAWKVSKHYRLMTQSDLLLKRFDNKFLSVFTTCILMFYTIPYLMVGVIGGGRTFAGLTHGVVPYWVGALVVTLIVCLYVALGGMRGTAWTNALQTVVFMLGGVIMFVMVAYALGGPSVATQKIASKFPSLLNRAKMPMSLYWSYGIIVSLAVPMFPQVYIRLLTGNKPAVLRRMTMIYPFAAIFIWFLMAYIGMWGHLAFPGLKGGASDKILPMLISKYAPIWMSGILGAAIFAALMSSLDAQLLTLGTMFIKDFLMRADLDRMEKGHVLWSRIIVIVFAFIAFLSALIKPVSIIKIIEWSFGGYASIIIPFLGALYWKRCTAAGCIAALIASQVLLLGIPIGLIPKFIAFGTLPGIPALIVGTLVLVLVSLVTKPPHSLEVKEFFSTFENKNLERAAGVTR